MNQSAIGCEDALRLLAAHLDRELGGEEDALVKRHLETCRSCFSRAEFEQRLKAQVAQLGREPVTPALDLRVRRIIQEHATVQRDSTKP